MKRAVRRWCGLGIVVVTGLALFYTTFLDFGVPSAFSRVRQGETAEEVASRFWLGPTVTPGRGRALYWEGRPLDVDPSVCVGTYTYRLPLPWALLGDPRWEIGFDSSGRVVSKYHSASE